MRTLSLLLALCAMVLLPPAFAADYKCAAQQTGVKLNDLDTAIRNREEAVSEMEAEAREAGGTTDQHKQVLQSFEEKLEKAKAEREALLAECNGAR